MDDITLPPEALEKAAREAYKRDCARGSNTAPPWEFLPLDARQRLLDDARAACLALIQSWPNANWDEAHTIGIILPLPLTENSNERE